MTINLPSHLFLLNSPKDFASSMEVVGCFIHFQNQILFLKRHPLKSEGNTWCVPGGKRESTETLLHAMQREIHEESGLFFPEEELHYCFKAYVRYPTADFIYHVFNAEIQVKRDIRLSPQEHVGAEWLTIAEAKRYPLTPGIQDALYLLFNKEVKIFEESV